MTSQGSSDWSERATTALKRLDSFRQPTSASGRVAVGVAALALFGFVVYLAARSLPTLTDPNPWLVLVLVLVTTPVVALFNAVEFRLVGRSVGEEYSFMAATRVTLLGSIANFLPAPGSFVVRTGSLSKRGVGLRAATSANVLTTVLWLGTTAVIAGVALASAGAPGFGIGSVAAGVALSAASMLRIARSSSGRIARGLLYVEVVLVLLSAVRTWIAFRTLGEAIPASDAVIIGTSQVLATMIGIAPAGLGIRELLAAALAATVGVDAALTVAATAVDRAASQVGFLVIGVVFVATGQIRSGELLGRLRLRRSAPAPIPEDAAGGPGDEAAGDDPAPG